VDNSGDDIIKELAIRDFFVRHIDDDLGKLLSRTPPRMMIAISNCTPRPPKSHGVKAAMAANWRQSSRQLNFLSQPREHRVGQSRSYRKDRTVARLSRISCARSSLVIRAPQSVNPGSRRVYWPTSKSKEVTFR